MSFRFVGAALSILGTPVPSDVPPGVGTAPSPSVQVQTRSGGPIDIGTVPPVPAPAPALAVPPVPTPTPVRSTAPVMIRPPPTVVQATPAPVPTLTSTPTSTMAMASLPPAPPPPDTRGASPGGPDAAVQALPQAEGARWHVHLASYRSAGGAERGWTELRHVLPAVLGTLTPSKVSVVLKGKGTFVRLLAGPFDDRDAAEKLCAVVSQSHLYCQPLAPGREAR